MDGCCSCSLSFEEFVEEFLSEWSYDTCVGLLFSWGHDSVDDSVLGHCLVVARLSLGVFLSKLVRLVC
jgi:hypothetical protein